MGEAQDDTRDLDAVDLPIPQHQQARLLLADGRLSGDDRHEPFQHLMRLLVYNAPVVATGVGPFDVVHHTNTGDRVLGIHISPPSPPGQLLESWADMLFVKGFGARQPIVYLSTDAGQALTAVLERSTYVPGLDQAAYNGGDDFLGLGRERLFGSINNQTGIANRQVQGFQYLVVDGHASEDASGGNTTLINAMRNGGDLFEVFGTPPS
jgi:hypothetical protein